MALSGIRALVGLVRDDLKNHGGDWSKPGFQALAVHRLGVWRMGIAPLALRAPFSVTYRALFRFVRNFYGIELPYTARVGRGVIIEHQGGIVVHGASVIGDNSILRQGVTLGNRTLLQPNDAPRVGNNVNIGAGAKLLGKITVGDGATIGANSVVLSDVAAGKRVGGIPSRELPYNAPEVPQFDFGYPHELASKNGYSSVPGTSQIKLIGRHKAQPFRKSAAGRK